MAEVKHYIQNWRELKEQVRIAEVARETSRKALCDEDNEHVKAVEQWDLQRANLAKAISDVKKAVADDHDRATALMRDADSTMARALEQRSRNEEHRQKLSAHLKNLHTEAAKIETRDAPTAQQLLSFRVERERCRSQLHQAIQALKTTLPKEREETSQKIDEASHRKETARKQLEADKKRWAMTVDARKRERYEEMLVCVEEEQEAAAVGKQSAKQMKSQIQQSLGGDEQLLSQLRQLRGSLSRHLRPATTAVAAGDIKQFVSEDASVILAA